MRIGTIIVPALALLFVAVSGDVRAQPQQQQPHRATPQAQAPPQGGTQASRRLGRSYPAPPLPIQQREAPQFYVATPQASSIHQRVGGSRNDGSRMGDGAASGAR